MKKEQKHLQMWQARYEEAKTAYAPIREKFDSRDELFRGSHKLRDLTEARDGKNAPTETSHCWNIIAENIESEVDSSIPMPKVTARREKDKERARIIENMLRNEMQRISMEEINDEMERYVPVQGGAYYLTEWDNTVVRGSCVGDTTVSAIHPKQFIPQPGVYTGVDDMDYFFLDIPQTKGYILRAFGVDVSNEKESEPQVKGTDAQTENTMITQHIAYGKNNAGGICMFSWVNDHVLIDMEDYQARKLCRCKKCGALQTSSMLTLERPTLDGTYPGQTKPEEKVHLAPNVCGYCGSDKWEESTEEYEELYEPTLIDGEMVGGYEMELDEDGNAQIVPLGRIPFFKPNTYPVVLQKNISVFGQLLGESDVDRIADQQNTINRIEQKIIDRLMKAGTRVTLPDDPSIRVDERDGEVWRLSDPSKKAMVGTYQFDGDVSAPMAYIGQVYEEGRRVLGITDSFQGRRDTTATSGEAKKFAAAQAAGRMESKRQLKRAAYQKLYRHLFENKLAYADEPRPLVTTDEKGESKFDYFSRYDFLEKDEAGQWRYVTDFIFDCDEAATLARNRPNMWQEITQQFTAGTFGDPTQKQTLLLYWTKMELEHYPGAGQTKAYIERQIEEEKQMAMQAQMQMQMQGQMDAQAIEQQARQDAAAFAAQTMPQ